MRVVADEREPRSLGELVAELELRHRGLGGLVASRSQARRRATAPTRGPSARPQPPRGDKSGAKSLAQPPTAPGRPRASPTRTCRRRARATRPISTRGPGPTATTSDFVAKGKAASLGGRLAIRRWHTISRLGTRTLKGPQRLAASEATKRVVPHGYGRVHVSMRARPLFVSTLQRARNVARGSYDLTLIASIATRPWLAASSTSSRQRPARRARTRPASGR